MSLTGVMSFDVPGAPVPKQSTRFSGAGGVFRTYSTGRVRVAQHAFSLIATSYMQRYGFNLVTVPCIVRLQYVFPMPGRLKGEERTFANVERLAHAVRPDLDNLDKLAFDAMKGVVIADDKLICGRWSQKVYGPTPLTRVEVHAAGFPLEEVKL